MENVRDLKVFRSRELTAARHYSGIGQEHSMVGATTLHLVQLNS
jgi:hypothetical protein